MIVLSRKWYEDLVVFNRTRAGVLYRQAFRLLSQRSAILCCGSAGANLGSEGQGLQRYVHESIIWMFRGGWCFGWRKKWRSCSEHLQISLLVHEPSQDLNGNTLPIKPSAPAWHFQCSAFTIPYAQESRNKPLDFHQKPLFSDSMSENVSQWQAISPEMPLFPLLLLKEAFHFRFYLLPSTCICFEIFDAPIRVRGVPPRASFG